MTDDPLPAGGFPVGEDPPWDAWDPREITERLGGVDVPWCVAAGRALDLFRGEITREHEDLEIAVPIAMFDQVRAALADFDVDVVDFAGVLPLLDQTQRAWLAGAHPGPPRTSMARGAGRDGLIARGWMDRSPVRPS